VIDCHQGQSITSTGVSNLKKLRARGARSARAIEPEGLITFYQFAIIGVTEMPFILVPLVPYRSVEWL
jgi:hypothetical protein